MGAIPLQQQCQILKQRLALLFAGGYLLLLQALLQQLVEVLPHVQLAGS